MSHEPSEAPGAWQGPLARRLVRAVRFVLLGLVVVSIGNATWSALVAANLRTTPGIPWACPAMLIALAFYWLYVGGSGWPATTAGRRRDLRRACAVDRNAWILALSAGLAGTFALAALWLLLGRMTGFPPNRLPHHDTLPALVWIPLITTASIVAPVCEEVGFRGYMQGPLERLFGARSAVTVTAVVFALAHIGHGAHLGKLAVYLLAGLLFGTIARLTRSILPGIAVHACADLLFFSIVWPRDFDRPPWKLDGLAISQALLVLLGAALCVGLLLRLARHSEAGVGGPSPQGSA